MAWRIELTETAAKQLSKIDKVEAKRIIGFLRERLAGHGNPRSAGKALQGSLGELWRYRVGDYRIICEIFDGMLRVLVLRIQHRSKAHRN